MDGALADDPTEGGDTEEATGGSCTAVQTNGAVADEPTEEAT